MFTNASASLVTSTRRGPGGARARHGPTSLSFSRFRQPAAQAPAAAVPVASTCRTKRAASYRPFRTSSLYDDLDVHAPLGPRRRAAADPQHLKQRTARTARPSPRRRRRPPPFSKPRRAGPVRRPARACRAWRLSSRGASARRRPGPQPRRRGAGAAAGALATGARRVGGARRRCGGFCGGARCRAT